MSTEKDTIEVFNFNDEIFLLMVEERFDVSITNRDIYEIVNKSYGIKYDDMLNVVKYTNELAKRSKMLKEEGSILYTFFDITLGIITKKVIGKDDANKLLDEMIFDRMCELTGNNKHKNEN